MFSVCIWKQTNKKLLRTRTATKAQSRPQFSPINIFILFSIKNHENQYENFWGLDTFEMMLDYIASPDSFNDQQMKQIERLPEGVQQKRV